MKQEIATLGPNTLLPTENAMAAQFHVSRVTIRQALGLLEQSGAITRTRGKGTVVNPPKVVRNNIPMCTVEDDFRQQGIDFVTTILGFESESRAPRAVAEALRLRPDDRVGVLTLTRSVRSQIICAEQRYLIPKVARRFDPARATSATINGLVSALAGAPIESVEFETEIIPADGEVGAWLGVTPGTSILQNRYVYFLPDGTPVDTGSISYRVDRCKFRARGRFPTRGDAAVAVPVGATTETEAGASPKPGRTRRPSNNDAGKEKA